MRVVNGVPVLDLDYVEDSTAEVDLNVVMTGGGDFVEVQGTAEGVAFSRKFLDVQLSLAELGAARLTQIQREALGAEWPLDTNSCQLLSFRRFGKNRLKLASGLPTVAVPRGMDFRGRSRCSSSLSEGSLPRSSRNHRRSGRVLGTGQCSGFGH